MNWLVPWEPSPTLVVALLIAATSYARGAPDRQHPVRRAMLFYAGLGLTYVVTQTHLEYFSEHEFFLHRLQHLVLHHIAPFLLILSHPLARLRQGLPRRIVAGLDRMLATSPGRGLHALWRNPALAGILFVGIVLLWLAPPVHLLAMLDWRLYRVMNLSVFLTGLMFFNLCLPLDPDRPSAAPLGTRVAMLVGVMPPQILLGALMFFADQPFYSVYSLCGRALTHLSEIADQQIGALILWIPGSMMSVVALVIIMRIELARRHPRGGSLLQRFS